ncbi:hypothetical protein NQ314_001047 [Rhamnusium bicolor]|uniref:ANK_REP_REGION domain-containing protein n=1 Tax=Rhamnusium bicolor TaxID=1586634 RepID=A0AAV8ZTB6_9CUCU|nr:hypothetical protein NQ314_001047 [Rhamnusium bicolor]
MSKRYYIQDQGVDPNLRDGDGATPLHFAASRGHLDTVRWLLKHGARLSLDKFGKSPINDAAENQQVEVSKIFHSLHDCICLNSHQYVSLYTQSFIIFFTMIYKFSFRRA